jgi:uncharacterized membrane protein YedE/YeeE
MQKFYSLVLGILFGLAISKANATDYNYIIDMFLFKNFYLYGVITFAIITVSSGVFILKKLKAKDITGKKMEFPVKPAKKGLVLGAILFGIGWAITGTCPGPAITMVGEGKLTALVTLVGIFAGTYAHSLYASNSKEKVDDTCG